MKRADCAKVHHDLARRRRPIRSVLRRRLPSVSRFCRPGTTGQAVRHAPWRRQRTRRRRGVTLLELIVVIALLGLILAIAAPAIVFPSEKKESELTTIIGTARRAAVLRGEPVTLTFDGANWRIASDAAPSAPAIAAGSLATSLGTLRVYVSPLGTCLADAGSSAVTMRWSALDCRFVSGPEARAP